MKMFKYFAVASITTVVGCATNSGVVPVGNGNYEIAGSSATALSSGGSQKIKLLKIANEYCAKQGTQATLVSADASNGRVGSMASANANAYGPNSGATYHAQAVQPGQAATADIIFRCE